MPHFPLHSYLSRNVALDGIGKLAVSIGSEAAVISLAALQKGASDAVPNVRFNAIKALRFVAPLLPPQDVASIVLPIMRNLAAADSDVDVCLLCAFTRCIVYNFSSPVCIPGPVFCRGCPRSVVLRWQLEYAIRYQQYCWEETKHKKMIRNAAVDSNKRLSVLMHCETMALWSRGGAHGYGPG